MVKAKLSVQRMGPFKILRKVGRGAAYELDIPSHYRIHPVISVMHLEPAPAAESDPYMWVPVPIEPIVRKEGEELWEIESVLKRREVGRGRKRRVGYLIRWKGWSEDHDQWVNEKEIGEKPTLG